MGDRLNVPLNSPCIGRCELDEKDICLGCHRTLDEIAEWSDYTPHMRQEVRDRIARDHPAANGEAESLGG